VPPLWLTYTGEKWRTLGKGYEMKWGAISNTLEEKKGNLGNIRRYHWEHWEHHWERMGTWREHTNLKIHPRALCPPPPLPHLSSPSHPKRKKINPLGCMFSQSLAACIFYSETWLTPFFSSANSPSLKHAILIVQILWKIMLFDFSVMWVLDSGRDAHQLSTWVYIPTYSTDVKKLTKPVFV